MWLIQRFCNQLGLRRLLQRYIPAGYRSSPYHPSELFLALMFAIIMGLRRINKTEILQYNPSSTEPRTVLSRKIKSCPQPPPL
jgi:hypothetical protein